MSLSTRFNVLPVRAVATGFLLAFAVSVHAQPSTSVGGIWQTDSKAATVAELKRVDYPEASVAAARFAPIEADRVQRLLRKQGHAEPLQIGIARDLATESDSPAVPDLHWLASADGGQVARMEVTSPGARALRVGIRVNTLPDGTELRVFGSADPARIVDAVSARRIRASLVANDVYWTPHTDGETQTIEWYVPAGRDTAALQIRLTGASHLLASAAGGFLLPKAACDEGDAGPNCSAACEVDVVCEQNPGAGYQAVVAAVTQMEFVMGGNAFLCTGTLLNNTGGTQIPYLLSAHHCLDGESDASTLNTFWFVQNIHCGGAIQLPPTFAERSGGADVLYSDASSDVLLLRLRDTPPGGAFFAGWDANPVANGASMIVIHHPVGDVKKVSHGTVEGPIASATTDTGVTVHDLTGVSFSSGIVEGGSSGSALLTHDGNGNYFVRGGLFGISIDLSCALVGQPPDNGNIAAFSRFDVAFPHLQQWLAPDDDGFQITPGITGNWYDPSQSGHGFGLEVLPGNVMLLDWYVFAPNGGQAWVAAIGSIEGDTAVLDAAVATGSGARFPPNFNPSQVHSEPWGTITLTFTDCDHGEARWQPTMAGYPNGSMPIVRLTQPAGLSCP
ncbi:MAG TPA: serine protease [Rhodanobacteraceae bacterium]|nr:serine protease [Rhodanobacteraceae bacterium]